MKRGLFRPLGAIKLPPANLSPPFHPFNSAKLAGIELALPACWVASSASRNYFLSFQQQPLRQLIHKFAFMKSNLLDLLLACRAAGLLGAPFTNTTPFRFVFSSIKLINLMKERQPLKKELVCSFPLFWLIQLIGLFVWVCLLFAEQCGWCRP